MPDPAAPAISIARLTLTDFRSHAAVQVEALPGLVVVTGDNGQGKTNLLEALSMLAPGRGLRGGALGELARRGGSGGWAVAARIEAPGGAVEIGTGTLAAAPERRSVRINGAAAPLSRLAEWLSLVWLTPAMDRLFSDSAAARRRFLDRLVLALDPAHGGHAARYEAAMRQRTRLLTGAAAPDPAWLDALERAMAEHGAALAAGRAATVAALAARLPLVDDGVFALPQLALPAPPSPDARADGLKRARAADAAAGRATLGPHRDDLAVRHAATDMAASQASTGEQKALLIAIVLAHAGLVAARTGRAPVLLLDEVAAHLDARRRAALFERLAASGAQAWMTGTDAALFAEARAATRLHITGGIVSPAAPPGPSQTPHGRSGAHGL